MLQPASWLALAPPYRSKNGQSSCFIASRMALISCFGVSPSWLVPGFAAAHFSTTCAATDDDRIAALEKRVAAIEEYIQVATEGH